MHSVSPDYVIRPKEMLLASEMLSDNITNCFEAVNGLSG